MSSVGDVRAYVLRVADEAPIAQTVAALEEIERRAQTLRARLHSTGDQEVDAAAHQLGEAAGHVRTVIDALSAATDLCRLYAASI